MDPAEAEEMFDFADKDNDCRIGWEEFQVFVFVHICISYSLHSCKEVDQMDGIQIFRYTA